MFDFQEIWDTVLDFCTDNYIWVIAVAGLLVLVIIISIVRNVLNRDKDGITPDWMDDFERRVAEFEKKEGANISGKIDLEEDHEECHEEYQPKRTVDFKSDLSSESSVFPPSDLSSALELSSEEGENESQLESASEELEEKVYPRNIQYDIPISLHLSLNLDQIKVTCDNLPDTLRLGALQQKIGTIISTEDSKMKLVEEETQQMFGGVPQDEGLIIEQIDSLKRENIHEQVSVSRSGRIYSEEELRKQIRK